MAETRPLAPIKASRRTSPATCWVVGSAGYAGGTEEIMRAGLTSPPTGTGAAGAAGCFPLPSNRPAVEGDSLAGRRSSAASSVGSASPLRGVRALRLTLGFAKRTLPRLGLLISGSASSEDGLGVLAASTVAAGVETRSEMAAGWSLAAEPDEETGRTLEPEAVVVTLASGAESSAVPALAFDDGPEIDAALQRLTAQTPRWWNLTPAARVAPAARESPRYAPRVRAKREFSLPRRRTRALPKVKPSVPEWESQVPRAREWVLFSSVLVRCPQFRESWPRYR